MLGWAAPHRHKTPLTPCRGVSRRPRPMSRRPPRWVCTSTRIRRSAFLPGVRGAGVRRKLAVVHDERSADVALLPVFALVDLAEAGRRLARCFFSKFARARETRVRGCMHYQRRELSCSRSGDGRPRASTHEDSGRLGLMFDTEEPQPERGATRLCTDREHGHGHVPTQQELDRNRPASALGSTTGRNIWPGED
jgi:hypothetical protein